MYGRTGPIAGLARPVEAVRVVLEAHRCNTEAGKAGFSPVCGIGAAGGGVTPHTPRTPLYAPPVQGGEVNSLSCDCSVLLRNSAGVKISPTI